MQEQDCLSQVSKADRWRVFRMTLTHDLDVDILKTYLLTKK